jgi:hypothetical protein
MYLAKFLTLIIFRVFVSHLDGTTIEYYPITDNNNTEKKKAYKFIDWMQGETDEEIATRPNRYVYEAEHTELNATTSGRNRWLIVVYT